MSCPECGGVLEAEREAGVEQWRCQVGHRYSQESLAEAQAASVEAALWTAIRALQERGDLLERLAGQCQARDQLRSARSFRRKAEHAREQADQVRQALSGAATTSLRSLSEGDDDEQLAESATG
jgi:two-component system chemotaxis response regulator CheB